MNEYTVVPLDQVRPGDVAVCNGREFPVEFRGGQNQIRLGEWYVSATFASDTLGFEFRRMVPREPWKGQRWVAVTPSGVLVGTRDTKDDAENAYPGYRIFLADITEVLEP